MDNVDILLLNEESGKSTSICKNRYLEPYQQSEIKVEGRGIGFGFSNQIAKML